VLADQQAEAVAEVRLALVVAIASVRGGLTLIGRRRGIGSVSPAQFLDRAEPGAVSLAKGAVDGTGLGDAHLGAMDQGRGIGGICIAVTDEATRARRFVNGRLKDPAFRGRI
jgi:hypothetical protein